MQAFQGGGKYVGAGAVAFFEGDIARHFDQGRGQDTHVGLGPLFVHIMLQLQAVADDDVDAPGQEHGHQLARVLCAAVAGQVGLVEGRLVGITAHLADHVGLQVVEALPVLQAEFPVGHKDRGAAADRPDQLVLGLALGRAGKLEGHLDGAAVEQALDPCPGVEAQLVVDPGFGQHRGDQLDIQAARGVVIALDKTVGRELFVAAYPPGFGRRGGTEGKQQAEH